MKTLERAARTRIQKSFADRMAAVDDWHYDQPGEDTCPACFSTWISVRYTHGWEHLQCCECGARGPLPTSYIEAMRLQLIVIALLCVSRRTRGVRTEKCNLPIAHRRTPMQRHAHLNVAW